MAGSIRSPLAPWIGGGAGVKQRGYTSLLAPWLGGASRPKFGGYRSFLAFWMGGAVATVPGYGSPGREDYQREWERRQRLRRDWERDDEEIMVIIGAFLTGRG